MNVLQQVGKMTHSVSVNEAIAHLVETYTNNMRLRSTSQEERAIKLVSSEVRKGRGEDQKVTKTKATDRGLAELRKNIAAPYRLMSDVIAEEDRYRCSGFYWAMDAVVRDVVKQVFLLEKMPDTEEEANELVKTDRRGMLPQVYDPSNEERYFKYDADMSARDKFEKLNKVVLSPLRMCLETYLHHVQKPYAIARFWDGEMSPVFCDTWEDVESFFADTHPEDREDHEPNQDHTGLGSFL